MSPCQSGPASRGADLTSPQAMAQVSSKKEDDAGALDRGRTSQRVRLVLLFVRNVMRCEKEPGGYTDVDRRLSGKQVWFQCKAKVPSLENTSAGHTSIIVGQWFLVS